MNITCTWRFDIVADNPAEVPAEVDRIMGHLLELESDTLHDAAIGLDMGAPAVEISISVVTESLEQGVVAAMAAIRTAIHAAGGDTADWPDSQHIGHSGMQLRHGQLTAA